MTRDHDDELKREIEAHLAAEAEERLADGESEAEAYRAARLAFGNVTRTREDVRAVWTRRWVEDLGQDVRYALRRLRMAPGFTAVVVLTLALGIGANAAMFSIVNAVLLKPLGYPRPEKLRFLTTRFEPRGVDESSLSLPEYLELVELSQSFSVIGAFTTGEVNLSARDRPRRVKRATVNAELLEALGVNPERGRWFRRDETQANGPPLVILSHGLWRSALGGRPDVVGQSVEIDGMAREVVGVMPAGFDLMDGRVDVWLPLQLPPFYKQFRQSHFLGVLGRLKDDVSGKRADAELASLVATWGPRTGVREHVFEAGGHVLRMEPLQDQVVGSARRALWVLQAAVAFVLLIVCANLANLVLARARTRGRELAVRAALGASRRRLLALFATEGVVLSLLGGALGLALAWGGVRAVVARFPESLPRLAEIALDPAVLGFTLLASVASGVAFSLSPLVDAVGGGLRLILSERAGSLATGVRDAFRRALVVAEVALAVVLVMGAALMGRTLANLVDVEAGFDRSRLVSFGIALPSSTYPELDQRLRLTQRLVDRLHVLPGVEAVAAAAGPSWPRAPQRYGTDIEGYAPPPGTAPDWVDYYQGVSLGYFAAMGIEVVRGRPFEPTDRVSGPVAVVNEAFARRFWAGRDPVGRRVRPRFGAQVPWATVVGVARDVRQAGVDQPAGTELYFLLDQLPRIFPATPGRGTGPLARDGALSFVLRGALPLATLQPAIGAVVGEADPALPVIRLRSMEEVVDDSLTRPRLLMHLLGGFAVLALLLAALGTYGVLSWQVAERRREIGLRMALGARRAGVLWRVLRDGLSVTSVGLALGVGGALALTRSMEALLFEVRPMDLSTLAAVTGAIALVAGVACLVPAHRATRVDPLSAMREEG
jgi:predicted permease